MKKKCQNIWAASSSENYSVAQIGLSFLQQHIQLCAESYLRDKQINDQNTRPPVLYHHQYILYHLRASGKHHWNPTLRIHLAATKMATYCLLLGHCIDGSTPDRSCGHPDICEAAAASSVWTIRPALGLRLTSFYASVLNHLRTPRRPVSRIGDLCSRSARRANSAKNITSFHNGRSLLPGTHNHTFFW